MKHFLLGCTLALSGLFAQAQVVTTQPAIVQQSTDNIVVTFHANEGNKGIENLKPPVKVYAHTGVITNKSGSDSDWKHAPSWGDNDPKYELTWVADNTWTLNIPSIDKYYGLSADEVVKKLAFVFRASNGAEGKTASNGDIFVNVAPAGFQMQLTHSPEGNVITGNGSVTFTAATTAPANIAIYVGSIDSKPIGVADGVTELSTTYTFDKPGDYNVIAVATSTTGETATVTNNITRLGASAQVDYPGGIPKMGYTIADNGDVTFCLAAPGKNNVVMVGSWNDYKVSQSGMMNYQDYNGNRYFWITQSGLEPTKDYFYYYLVDGERAVGDPYARLVLDPYNDKYIPSSVFPNLPAYPSDKVQNVPLAWFNATMDAYEWQVPDFKGVDQSDLVVYELLLRDFTGTEGQKRANGTVKAAIEKLDYLQSLGVNAVELLPIMEFNGNISWGYNTNFYFAADKAYGTPDDYRLFVDECHKRGMAVILDIVFNQSDGLHPWYQMYDIAKNPFYNGSAPHAYSVLNDWNQDNPLVQQQWYDALDYWMTAYNVDGFRFDLVKGLGNNDSYSNTYYPATNTWGNPSDANTNRFNATRVARMKALHDSMRKTKPDAYFINENLAGAQEENDMAKDGELNWANINTESCQYAMGYSSNSNLNRFYAPKDSRTWGSTISYAESHDEERMAYKQIKYGVADVKNDRALSLRRLGSVAAQMLLTPGAHMIWQFQELGDDQSTKDANGGNNTDPKKVVWSLFDKPENRGLYQSYRDLNRIRATYPEMFTSDVAVTVNFNGAWANGRTLKLAKGDKEILLFINPQVTGNVTMTTGMTGGASNYKLLSQSYGTEAIIGSDGRITLQPGAYAVYATNNMAGITNVDAQDNTPAVYYNLQGMRVLNPERGNLYICKKGNTVTKIIF